MCALEADSRGCRKAAVSGQDAGRGWRSREEEKGNCYNFWSKLITKRGI